MSSPVFKSYSQRTLKWDNNYLKRPLPFDKHNETKASDQSPIHINYNSISSDEIVGKTAVKFSQSSFNNSINLESLVSMQPHQAKNPIHPDASFDSFSSFESQDSQPLRKRIRKRLSRCSPPSLHGKKNEESKKNTELESISKCFDSQPGFELGPFFGLPSRVAELFSKYKGISQLYEWQEECVKEGIQGGNLLISLPTSGGKTLVAEILMLRQIMIFEKNVLVILPYVTLVQEKVRGLAPFAIDLEFVVEEYAGSKGVFPPKKRKKCIVYIATIEKANILIDTFMENGCANELGLVVADEVHMLGDNGGRGAKLENALIKLRFLAKSTQIVSMSATVGNVKELSSFLDAKLYTGSFRPIPLTEYIKVGDQVAEINPKAHSEEDLLLSMYPCSYEKKHQPEDSNCIMSLILGIIPKQSILVFCSTRRNAEAVALMLKTKLPNKDFLNYKEKEKSALLRALKEEIGEDSLCPILRKTVPYGIGYHHSGLTEGERKLIEEGYQCNTLCCLVCTSTLAAGVNLPARRVIIRSPYVGREFLTRSRYQQMIGRAGRAGLDSKGESFIVTSRADLAKVGQLLLSPVENCVSKLVENDFEGLSELVFSMLGLKIITTLDEALSMVHLSLLHMQAKQLGIDVDKKVKQLLEKQYFKGFLSLKSNKPLEINKDFDKENCKGEIALKNSPLEDSPEEPIKAISISRLGRAAIKGGVNLTMASQLYTDLLAARSHLALHSHLHLLYLVTPYNVHESLVFKSQVFSDIYQKLTKEELEVAKVLGITEAVAVKLIIGAPTKVDKSIIHRFYATLMLHQLLNGKNFISVSLTFDVHRGSIQQLLFSSASFASCVNRFCQELDELWAFQDLFGGFSRKLSSHCSPELTPLMELPTVKAGRARLLYRAGFKTLNDIANAEAASLVNSVDHLSYKASYQIISSAKMLLLQKAEALQEEAEELLRGLGNDPETSFLSSYQKTTS